jgi:hypothetical protein
MGSLQKKCRTFLGKPGEVENSIRATDLDLPRNVYLAFTDAKGALNLMESSLVALSPESSI